MDKLSEIRKQIEANNKKLGEHIKKGDAKALASLYTKDAVLLPTGSNIVKGNEAIREFWDGAIKGMGVKELNLKTVEVVGKGDTVTEMGEYHTKLTTGEDRGKYVVVWKSIPEGWKLHWDMWNTNKPTT